MRYKLFIKGKNINKFIKRLNTNNIDLLDIKILNKEEMTAIVSIYDYESILKIKTIYEVIILKEIGYIAILNKMKKYNYIIISFIISGIFLFILSNLIFNIKVIHTDSKLKEEILIELKEYGIDKYKVIPSRKKITEIEKKILEKNKDKLEWISISVFGTYIEIKVEERIMDNNNSSDDYIEIVAKKSGIIQDIYATKGEKKVDENTYVKKGDVIISSNVSVNDQIKDIVSANGSVYAEVWYTVHVTYPLHYQNSEVTNNKINLLSFNFINSKIPLFKKNKYKFFNIDQNKLLYHNMLPISLSYDTVYEVNNINENLTVDEAVIKAGEIAYEKLNDTLKEDEYIIAQKTLKKIENNSIIELDIFFRVYENITEIKILSDDEIKSRLNINNTDTLN